MAEYKKLLPKPTSDTKPYWDACRRHELVVQRCKDCETYRFYPSAMCTKCFSMNYEWHKVSGKGTVYTWTVVWNPPGPQYADDVPYIPVVVELNEQPGLFMPGRLLECDPKDVRAGMPVAVVFVDVTEEITLPHWQPVSKGTKKSKP